MHEDLQILLACGRRLDAPCARTGGSFAGFLMAALLKLRDREGRLVPLALNRAQQELSGSCAPRRIILKARQLGVTTWIAARFFLRTITRPGTLTVQVAHDQDSAEELFRIVHRFQENLPERLRAGAARTSRANVRQIVFPHLDSQYRVETAADPNAGRGLTIQNLHASEVARWPRDAAATLASLRAAVAPGGEIFLESTPNGAGGCFYDEWQRADATGYERHFFPWWYEPSYTLPETPAGPMTPEEQELIARAGLTGGQIAYRRKLLANFRGLAAQEYAEDSATCFLASGDCVFDVEAVERRLPFCNQGSVQRDNGRLRIWFPPLTGRRYVMGVDPAGGGSEGDYACVQIIDRSTGLQCAELQAHLAPAELAHRVAALAHEYNQALVVVERNNHGHAVLALLQTAERYGHLYQEKGRLGWLTTAANRPMMIENFAAVLSAAPQLFQSARLLGECRSFVRHADGSTAAIAGAHDDCVLAMALALAARQQLAACSADNRLMMEVAAAPAGVSL
jgi:hypothetical protein